MNPPTFTFAHVLQLILQAQAHCLASLTESDSANAMLAIEAQNSLHQPKIEWMPLRSLLDELKPHQSQTQYSQNTYDTLASTFIDNPQPHSIEDATWDSPFYRALIESDLPIDAVLTYDKAQSLLRILKKSAKDWGQEPHLVHEQFPDLFEKAWLRIEVKLKEKFGIRRLGAV